MRRIAAILTLVAVVSLLGASDVRGGNAGAPAGKTTGSSVVATIVMDLTGAGTVPPKGLTSIRLQRSGSSAAALFTSGIIFGVPCNDVSVVGDTNGRFVGNLNGWVSESVRISLFGAALKEKAVITDTDYPACTNVDGGFGGGIRNVLSFTAVIQFEK